MAGKLQFKPGEVFVRFLIQRLLGEGGLGAVYEATYGGQPCAIKIVRSAWLHHESHRRRLVREGQLMIWLRHRNIVEVHEVDVTPDGIAWMRMERLHGLTLRELLGRVPRLSPALACVYLRQAAHGVHQGHTFGAVHRDLKPENLFVTRQYIVKVLDFGIARLHGSPDTLDQQTHGTPGYMAPEQIRDEPVARQRTCMRSA